MLFADSTSAIPLPVATTPSTSDLTPDIRCTSTAHHSTITFAISFDSFIIDIPILLFQLFFCHDNIPLSRHISFPNVHHIQPTHCLNHFIHHFFPNRHCDCNRYVPAYRIIPRHLVYPHRGHCRWRLGGSGTACHYRCGAVPSSSKSRHQPKETQLSLPPALPDPHISPTATSSASLGPPPAPNLAPATTSLPISDALLGVGSAVILGSENSSDVLGPGPGPPGAPKIAAATASIPFSEVMLGVGSAAVLGSENGTSTTSVVQNSVVSVSGRDFLLRECSQIGHDYNRVSLPGKLYRQPHWFFVRVAGPLGLLDQPHVEYREDPFVTMVMYNAMSEDEMTVYPGNMVLVHTVFRDGWGLGQNLDTGMYGVLPLDVLRLADVIPSFNQSAHRIESRAYLVAAGVISHRREKGQGSASLTSNYSTGKNDSQDPLYSGGALYSGGMAPSWDGNGKLGSDGSKRRDGERVSQDTILMEQSGEDKSS
ncbi:hypothetical protein M427DRAFT_356878 [Gonapodya prolifera JEL478]|uniref:SH3 domain-containing protein n=1 Tax=Gonapodya prolifera (strain JEL478) TaxID=1344416 RepID=A0A139AB90_GONPJ|nr:hypothetical protein M427DRAFT_356878 [Gonapodya prolifera JEL478]|eukprot:KXS14007.1 hypothetical protein M427DRAFT_356878 [Gonapodya prolifera JEL478]